ncbi:PDR/VanB family oxidoreductase [Pseudoduganella namucuonensis]|uniref:Vanillate O-demethylase ferredoxin subunit n=1 Tax=Pseudoduganella namucuonensis TaxID=1035707 RepID=A0A1I7LPD3_9BURK|nr:PDR/VanB family oxidoreductase [Pseudoduganella namucuonensis]SFV11577.1 vanillate O-demethylase ferredoxin subunit [Pseudoduganella namucuonensis]
MIEVIVTGRRDEADGICSFELAAADGVALPPFEPGAHIDVHLDGGLVRQYSLCPGPGQAGRYLLGVLREPVSRGGSAAMHALKTGQRLHISAPRNHFPLARDAQRHVLFAGGIGITPLLAMAEHLAASGCDFALHYCARAASRMAFAERIRAGIVGERATFHADDGGPQQKLDLDAALGEPREGVHVYVCGPGGFMDWVLSGARARGWPEDRLHKEYFAAPSQPAGARDQPFEVQIGRGGAIHTVPAGLSVLEVLARNGIDIPVSCEQGVCGTCLTRVLEGTPEHRDVFLTDQERAANDSFTPCCSRARSARLVLDL